MLGKLLKYDLKANRNAFLLMYAVLLAIAVGTRFSLMRWVYRFEGGHYAAEFGVLGSLLLSSYMIALITVNVLMLVLIIRRFRSGLFGSEGYLTFTLPVTASAHFWSKVISAVIWFICSALVQALSVFAAVPAELLGWEEVREAFGQVFQVLTGLVGRTDLILQLVMRLFGLLEGLMMIYFAICLGQLANRHRTLGALAAYFGLSFLQNMVNNSLTRMFMSIDWSFHSQQLIHYASGYYAVTALVSLLWMVIFAGGSILLMSRKLNLE